LQGRVYSPPYVIQAIGNRASLRLALHQSSEIANYQDYVRLLGLGYDLKSMDKVSFPACSGSLSLLNAKTQR
jgi:uncharacterized protein YlxW (UPF0749 family)